MWSRRELGLTFFSSMLDDSATDSPTIFSECTISALLVSALRISVLTSMLGERWRRREGEVGRPGGSGSGVG